ncbi:GerAB/ArcD/ProY family transporter [Clostridium sp. OS1-26]|uniref:GerAB/ArcD/ProY family transporter n=1 Tax=Clostridium sp. OS1-26 TaxID=3070681 RepID=UPI0027E11C7C|nr:GerAB/ArcD/ProY family transporter [Clostridium sp. OS1-26]WML37526.1 GerAB/ArcD/ProY family transporter [Clostridium sp. OS1-26]
MNKSFTNRQISFILYCTIVGYGVIDLPKLAAENGGTGSWFSLLILTIFFIIITYIITYLQYIYEGKTIYEYSQQLVGKLITYIFSIIYIVYFFINFSMITRIYAEAIKLIILNKTPVMVICFVFYMVVFYALRKGINVIARVCEIYGVLNILGFMVINSFLITNGKLVNVRPLFVMQDLMIYLKGMFKIIFVFLGMEMLMLLPVSRTANKKIFKYTTLIIAITGIVYIYIFESTISVVGVDAVIHYRTALLDIVRGVDIYYLEFFRRLDGIYIIYWSMNIFCATCLWGYGTITFTSKILKNIKYNYILVGITLIAFIAAQIPKTKEGVEEIIKYNAYLGSITAIIIPIILFVITKVKKYDKKIQ